MAREDFDKIIQWVMSIGFSVVVVVAPPNDTSVAGTPHAAPDVVVSTPDHPGKQATTAKERATATPKEPTTPPAEDTTTHAPPVTSAPKAVPGTSTQPDAPLTSAPSYAPPPSDQGGKNPPHTSAPSHSPPLTAAPSHSPPPSDQGGKNPPHTSASRTSAPTAAVPGGSSGSAGSADGTGSAGGSSSSAGPTFVPAPSSGQSSSPAAPGTAAQAGQTAAETLGWGEPNKMDEFDAGSTGWILYEGASHANKGKRSPSAVQVSNGTARITGDAQGTTGGMCWAEGQKHGRWEARVKAPPSDPTYEALLLLWPDADDFPKGGEIDFANMSDPTRQKTHFYLHHGPDNEQVSGEVAVDATQWHTWAVEWTPTYVAAFVDGKEWHRTTDASMLPPGPMHVCIQLDWFPEGDAKPKQSTMEVDWIKQYSVDGETAESATPTSESESPTSESESPTSETESEDSDSSNSESSGGDSSGGDSSNSDSARSDSSDGDSETVEGVWGRLAQCESQGRWDIATGNGYFGGLQFDQPTWERYSGTEYAPSADKATKEQQIIIAAKVRDDQRGYGAWPSCAQRLGLPRGG